ncbi:MAG: transglutaminase domain-containing protein [Desulfuromonas sp.]|nr:transglutaminase domain-containing protein [Desulfuromonas sp.]
MRRLFLLATLCCLATTATAWSAASRGGTVTMTVDLSAQKTGESARLWLPYPVSDRDQTVGDIRVSGDFASSGVYTDSVHGTPILYAEWPKDAASRKLTLAFSVTRQEIRLAKLPEREPKWNPADYAEYLKPTSLGPIDGEVKKLADRITKGKQTVLSKARAIYDWTVENMYRDPATRGCGLGDVCALLLKPGGKCTDISSTYIALCRAAGVPAREIFGLRLGKKAEEDITTWQHCWVEFFLPGAGWVPVDPADVRKAILVEKLEMTDPRVREYREYFWGGLDPYRFRLAIGRDLMLNPPQAGAPLNTFGYPYAEIGGQPLDFYDPKGFVYTIGYREK